MFLSATAVSARFPRAATIVEAVTVDENSDAEEQDDGSAATNTVVVTGGSSTNQVEQTDNQVRQLPVANSVSKPLLKYNKKHPY